MCNQIIGVPAQVKIGTEFVQGIVNTEAIAALDDASRALYPYDDPVGMNDTMTFYTARDIDVPQVDQPRPGRVFDEGNATRKRECSRSEGNSCRLSRIT